MKPKTATSEACNSIKKVVEDVVLKNGNVILIINISNFLEMKSELRKLDFSLFNYILYRCEAEEYDETNNKAYEIPNYGKFVYCGLQG